MAVVVVLSIAGGEDAPPLGPDPTPTSVPFAGPTLPLFATPAAPARHVVKYTPENGAKISQASTRTADARFPNGICADVDFEGLPENAQWFRIGVDNVEVTTTRDISWIVKSTTEPKDGRICYAPREGLSIGKHSAIIVVRNPLSQTEPPRQVVEWTFEVTP
jgi:hypothetical protein